MTFQIALSGLNAAGSELESISHNVANNTTTGFKRSRVEFADIFASSGFGPSVGQGVKVEAVRQEFAQGDTAFTNRNLDLAIEGSGLFKLNDNGTSVYTRAGNFGTDREGFLVDASGANLTGFGVDDNDEIIPISTDLQIDFSTLEPNQTTNMDVTANLDINAEILPPFDVTDPGTFNFTASTNVFDSLGSSRVANIYFRKDAANAWSAFSYIGDTPVSTDTVNGDQITFGTDGSLTDVNGNPDGTFTTDVFTPTGGEPIQIDVNLRDITQFDNGFGINLISQNGFAAGNLEDFDIDDAGIVFGRFSNGQSKQMGQITLTNFPNQEGLRQVGSTAWIETLNSGDPATGEPGSASLGRLTAGALEGSNVDITAELVSMIGAQRSFQANAQVISTGDTLTQTVINIRR